MRPVLRLVLAALLIAVVGQPGRAENAALRPFIGVYVGTAQVYEDGVLVEERDMDVTIREGERDGFDITWINVSLIDGRRDVPGVVRRVEHVVFYPAETAGLYVEEMRGSMFQSRREPEPMQGDPLRWADIHDDRIGVYSIVIQPDGSYELQTYDRILTEVGLDIVYERIVDGEVRRRVLGHTVRVE